jgi:hypothetical protein
MAAKKDNTLNYIALILGLLFMLRNLKLFGKGNKLFGSTVENAQDVKDLLDSADATGEIIEAKAKGLVLFLDPGQLFYQFETLTNGGQSKRSEIKAVPGAGQLFQIENVTAGQNGVAIVQGPGINVVEARGPGYSISYSYALEPDQVALIRSL